MLSKPCATPSKNALRVLRHLALGGSTIGAIGGICGVATVSYEIHRRIRFAEQLLERKKIIRSMSNGNGPTHLQRLFQAAENGEEFGIGVMRDKRRNKVRKFSSHLAGRLHQLAVEVSPEEEDAVVVGENSIESSNHRSAIHRIKNATISITHAPSHASFRRPTRRRATKPRSRAPTANLTAAERIMAATLEQHKLRRHATYGMPWESDKLEVGPLQNCVGQWLSRDRVVSQLDLLGQVVDNPQKDSKPAHGRLGFEKSPEALQDTVALGVPVLPDHEVQRSPSSSTTEILFGSDFRQWPIAKPTSGTSDGQRSYDVSHGLPIQHEDEKQRQVTNNPDSQRMLRTTISWDGQHLDLDSTSTRATIQKPQQRPSIDTPRQQDLTNMQSSTASLRTLAVPERIHDTEENEMRNLEKIEDASTNLSSDGRMIIRDRLRRRMEDDPQYREKIIKSGLSKYLRAVMHIHGGMAFGQAEDGRRAWREAVNIYATSDKALDFNLVDLLLDEFIYLFPTFVMSRPIRLLVQHLFAQSKISARAAEILFPLSNIRDVARSWEGAGPPKYTRSLLERQIMLRSQRYLDHVWAEEMNGKRLVGELRNVIAAAKRHGVVLTENLFATVLRCLCTSGDLPLAQSIFDEMVYYHQIQPTLYTQAIMVHGYGYIGDWARVEEEIGRLHDTGISRLRPLGFALMFNSVLAQYASVRSVEQTHELLVHAISFYGLVPTSAISTTAIRCYLTHRRYDLVREWVETVRTLFPRVDIETTNLAWQVGETWDKTQATCQEVESACEALVYKSRTPSFAGGFKAVACEAVARDLAAKLHAVQMEPTPGQEEVGDRPRQSENLDHYLERVYDLTESESKLAQADRVSENAMRDLQSQADSVARLRLRFQGKQANTDDNLNSAPPQQDLAPRRPEPQSLPSESTTLYSHFPPNLLEPHLPSREAMLSQLSDYYHGRQANHLPTSHAIIAYLCEKLFRQNRLADAAHVFDTVYNGPFVQGPNGVSFDLPLLNLWLNVAHNLKSLRHYRSVLWAVLDLGPQIRVSAKFSLLARMTAEKVCDQRFSMLSIELKEEVWWLLHRVFLKKKIQRGGVLHARFDDEPKTGKPIRKPMAKRRAEWKSRDRGFRKRERDFGTIHLRSTSLS